MDSSLLSLILAVLSVLIVGKGNAASSLRQGNVSSSTSVRRRLEQTSKHCQKPSPKRKIKMPDSLVGRAGKMDYDIYSGYLRVNPEEKEEEFLFYLLYTTQDQDPNAPLILWTNGGPGCSAMEGATTENGPLILFDIKGSGQAKAFSHNQYSINAHANVLYVDQPRRVGFSYGYSEKSISSSQEAAQDLIQFLLELYKVFPEFAHRQVILSGESYAGRYLPAFANAILDYNANQNNKNESAINLAALAIGNGCVNGTVQKTNERFVSYLRESHLISTDVANPPNYDKVMSAVEKFIGYTPNVYDYRLAALECEKCSGGYNYTAWASWMFNSDFRSAVHVCGNAGTEAFRDSGGCIEYRDFDKDDRFDYSGALARALDAGVKVHLFYGKTDFVCHYVGALAMADSLPWRSENQFRITSMRPLYAHGEIEVGQVKTFGALTFYQLENAGHMSFIDQPATLALVYFAMLKDLASTRQHAL